MGRREPLLEDLPALRLARMSDDIVDRILRGEPGVDVAIAIEGMRRRCEEWFPGRSDSFERLYESRFRRIWSQWRPDDPDLP